MAKLAATPEGSKSQGNAMRWALAATILTTIAIYGSLLNAPPLIWDDEPNIFANPLFLNGPWWSFWAAPYFGLYIPVVYSTWDVLLHVWHGAVWPFRALNLLLHVTNVLLFWTLLRGLLRKLDSSDEMAALTAVALFALHPLQTAAVSWLSGARDLAATTFGLLAVALFFSPRRGRIVVSTLLYAAALLCKPSVATLPIAMLAFAWIFDRGALRSTAITMAGWTLLAALSVAVTLPSQVGVSPVVVPILHRPLVALDALGFHLLKSLAPYPLAADYGRTPALVWANPRMTLSTLGTLALGVVVLWAAVRKDRRFLVVVAWPILLLPVLGTIPFAYQAISTVADHYDYLPLAVLCAFAAIALARMQPSASRLWSVFVAVVAVGGAMSWQRSRDWIGNERFFSDMLAKNPASMSARVNLSTTRCENGDWFNGLPVIEGAFRKDSASAKVLANVAVCTYVAGRFNDVIALQRRLRDTTVQANLNRDPVAAGILSNTVAGAYVSINQPLKAFVFLCQARGLQPQDSEIEANMARVSKTLADRGAHVRCPGLLDWGAIARGIDQMN